MSFIEFLDTLKNTLETIEVKGQSNIDAMSGCFGAIDEMKNSLIANIQRELAKPEPNGGEDVGRQSDIGTDTSNDSNGV